MKDILFAHGTRIRAVIGDAFGGGGKTKFIITAGDFKVCSKCQQAEKDGPIPINNLYSNGMMEPSFHGKTCRCQQVTSDELAAALDIKATDTSLEVGIIEPQRSTDASIREYGSGNGPPNPAVSEKMDNINDEAFKPLFDDLFEHYRERFMKK
jgi:hypothetical protein